MAKAKQEYEMGNSGMAQQIQIHMAQSCEIIHRCFDQCITNLNVATMTPEEERCMSVCALRFAHFIRRTAPKFLELHNAHNQKLMEDMQAKADQAAAAQASATGEAPAAAANGTSDVNQSAMNSGQHQTPS